MDTLDIFFFFFFFRLAEIIAETVFLIGHIKFCPFKIGYLCIYFLDYLFNIFCKSLFYYIALILLISYNHIKALIMKIFFFTIIFSVW